MFGPFFFVPVNCIRLLIFGTEQVKRTKFHLFFMVLVL